MPDWGLAVMYWLHMLATIAWLGSLFALGLMVIPAARRTLPDSMYAAFLGRIQISIQRVGWLSLAVLIATGMFQMSAHPAYEGFLSVNNPWAMAIFAKHAVIGLMVVSSAYVTWVLTPALHRMSFVQAAGGDVDPIERAGLLRRERVALRVNLVLSVIIILLTALARVS